PKQRNENLRDLGAPKDGPQDNSIAGQLHYVRLQETGRSADKDVEGAERPCRPVIPGTAKSYASHHRQKIRNGNLLGNLSRIDDVTFVFRRCSGGCVNRRIKIMSKASAFRAPFQLRVSAEQAVQQEVNRSSKQAKDGHHWQDFFVSESRLDGKDFNFLRRYHNVWREYGLERFVVHVSIIHRYFPCVIELAVIHDDLRLEFCGQSRSRMKHRRFVNGALICRPDAHRHLVNTGVLAAVELDLD